MSNIEFYKNLNEEIITNQLIPHYQKLAKKNEELKGIMININTWKFDDIVNITGWDLEYNSNNLASYEIKTKMFGNVKVMFISSMTIEYNSISSFPIYKNKK